MNFLRFTKRINIDDMLKRSEFDGGVTLFEGCGGFSGDGFTIHRFCGMPIRVKMVDGEPWFCLPDVCSPLGLDASQVVKRLDDEVVTIHPIPDRLGRKQNTRFINEDGLYDTILESRKPEAKAFRKWITKEVLPSIRKTGGYGTNKLPDFIERMRLNCNKLPYTHFSVLNELYTQVYKEFEKVGYILPDKSEIGKNIMPDISVGKCFAAFLKKVKPDVWKDCIKYEHLFADGRVVEALAYPLDLLPTFVRFVHEEWLPNKASEYFKSRDPKALTYLPKLLA